MDPQTTAREPVDPDVPEARNAGPRPPGPGQGPTIAVISAGGVIGALARYGLGVAWPTVSTAFPWTTFVINVAGCALMGVLVVLVTDVLTGRPLLRPFLGTGVLGGFTTFSTYALDGWRLIENGHATLALGYLVATVIAAMLVVTAASRATRWAVARWAPAEGRAA